MCIKHILLTTVILLQVFCFNSSANDFSCSDDKKLITAAMDAIGLLPIIEDYDVMITGNLDFDLGYVYIVSFYHKSSDEKPPIIGITYSVYFKQENSQCKFIKIFAIP